MVTPSRRHTARPVLRLPSQSDSSSLTSQAACEPASRHHPSRSRSPGIRVGHTVAASAEHRHLNLARCAPCRPEIQQHHLATQTLQIDTRPVQNHACDLGRGLIHQGIELKAERQGRSMPSHLRKGFPTSTSCAANDTFRASMTALNRISLLGPVAAKIVGDVEHLQLRESQARRSLKAGSDIRAAIPRATSAIEHDGFVFG